MKEGRSRAKVTADIKIVYTSVPSVTASCLEGVQHHTNQMEPGPHLESLERDLDPWAHPI